MNIIFDYNRTLFDPETNTLYPEARKLLTDLSARYTLFLISKNEPSRTKTIHDLGLEKFFQKIIFVPEKSKALFKSLNIHPKETIVIGDYLPSEIAAGNDFGATTIRILQGKFKDLIPASPLEKPNYQIQSLSELPSLLQQL